LESESNGDETLKHINSYFINEFIGLGTTLPKETKGFQWKPLLAAFAIVTGPNKG
jgi:hypothetical protein